ncbi:hypothetical protein [Nostoc sp. PCC 9305]|uniref:hypothetical protein n=1 Tax=Nostoc sp. PCC 9305 TaxID=296636 RepID=UPI0039C69E6F
MRRKQLGRSQEFSHLNWRAYKALFAHRYNSLDTKAVRSPHNKERLSRFSENSQ